MEESNVYDKMYSLSGHQMSVVSVKFSPNGQFLASAGADKVAQVYKLPPSDANSSISSSASSSSSSSSPMDSAEVVFRLEEHSAGLNDVVWHGDSHVVTASDDATIRISDVEYQKCIHTYRIMKAFPYTLAINPWNNLISMGDTDGSIAHYHVSTKDHIAKVASHASTVVSIAYNAQGDELISGGHDGTVRMWLSYLQGTSIGGMAKGLASSQSSNQYAALCLRSIVPCPKIFTPISCVGYAPNEQYVYCSVLDSSLRLYHRDYRMDVIDSIDQDIAHGYDSSKVTTNPTHIRQYKGHANQKHTIASKMITSPFQVDQYCLLSGSETGCVHLWDANSEDLIASVQLTEQGVVMGLDIFEQEAGKYLVANSGSDGLVKLWTLSPQSNFNKPSLPSSHQNQDEMMLTTTADVVGDAIPLSEAVESLPMEVVHMEE